jgi:hypothetical protein
MDRTLREILVTRVLLKSYVKEILEILLKLVKEKATSLSIKDFHTLLGHNFGEFREFVKLGVL